MTVDVKIVLYKNFSSESHAQQGIDPVRAKAESLGWTVIVHTTEQ